MSEMNGAGVLRRVLEDARQERRCSKTDLTVLSPQADPYRLDTPAGHRDGRWAAEQLERAVGALRRIHWRGLHYAIVAAGDIRKPNGELYRNTDQDWTWLTDIAGKAGRWLGYIDFERITDNRNSEPLIYRKARVSPEPWVSIGIDVTIPDVDDLKPYVGVTGIRRPATLCAQHLRGEDEPRGNSASHSPEDLRRTCICRQARSPTRSCFGWPRTGLRTGAR